MPLTLSAYYIRNLSAATRANDAVALGITLGKPRQAGDWTAFYRYQVGLTWPSVRSAEPPSRLLRQALIDRT